MEWISVKDRLPQSPAMYLISYNPDQGNGSVMMAYRFTMWAGTENAYDYWCTWPGCDDIDEGSVSYWADIEPPPDSKEKRDESLRETGGPA